MTNPARVIKSVDMSYLAHRGRQPFCSGQLVLGWYAREPDSSGGCRLVGHSFVLTDCQSSLTN